MQLLFLKQGLIRFENIYTGSDRITGNPALSTPDYCELKEYPDICDVCDNIFSFLASTGLITLDNGKVEYSVSLCYIPMVCAFIQAVYDKKIRRSSVEDYIYAIAEKSVAIIENNSFFQRLLNLHQDNVSIVSDLKFYNLLLIYSISDFTNINFQPYVSKCKEFQINSWATNTISQLRKFNSFQGYKDFLYCYFSRIIERFSESSSLNDVEKHYEVWYSPVNAYSINVRDRTKINQLLLTQLRNQFKLLADVISELSSRIESLEKNQLSSEDILSIKNILKQYNSKFIIVDKIEKTAVDNHTSLPLGSTIEKAYQTLIKFADNNWFRIVDFYTFWYDYYSAYKTLFQPFNDALQRILALVDGSLSADDKIEQLKIYSVQLTTQLSLETLKSLLVNNILSFQHLFKCNVIRPLNDSLCRVSLLLLGEYFSKQYRDEFSSDYYNLSEELCQIKEILSSSQYFSKDIFSFFEMYDSLLAEK